MRSSRVAAMVAFSLAGAWTYPLRAQTSIHATGSFVTAFTDNMLGAPDDPPEGEDGPIPIWFFQLAPGLAFMHDGPRSRHLLTYAHPFTFYPAYPDADTSGDIGAWRSIFTLTPRDELTLALAADRSTTNVGAIGYSAEQSTAAVAAPADSSLLSIDLAQGLTHDFTARWRLLETVGGTLVAPLDTPEPQPYRIAVRGSLGGEYTQGHNAVALVAHGTYFHHTAVELEDETEQPSEEQVLWGGTGRYRRDFDENWSGEVGAGVVAGWGSDGGTMAAPVWNAAVRFAYDAHHAELTYARDVTPNLLVGQTFLIDQIRLAGSIAVSRDYDLHLGASAGFAWNQLIDDNQELDSDTVNSWYVDAAFGWYPEEDWWPSIAARYRHFQQFGAEENTTVLPNFSRNLVMLTISGMFPPREVFEVPAGPGTRVDGGDRDPLAPGGEDSQLQTRPQGAPGSGGGP